MLVGNGITVGSYVKAQYLCCDLLGLRGIGVSFFMAPFVFFRGLTGVGDVIHFGGEMLLVA